VTVYNQHPVRVFWITNLVGAAQTVVAGGVGDVKNIITAMYAVEEETGGGSSGGVTTCTPGANVAIYDDGVDVVQLQVAAGGVVTVQRTAGADTFNIRLQVLIL
jgi:uncharacterized spore protein YtfJ